MRTSWVPGVDNLGMFDRWPFAEVTAVHEIGRELNTLIESYLTADTVA